MSIENFFSKLNDIIQLPQFEKVKPKKKACYIKRRGKNCSYNEKVKG